MKEAETIKNLEDMESNKGTDYENFIRDCPPYHWVNQHLLDYADLGDRKRIIDLGCGTGNITYQIISRLNSLKGVVIYAVDISQSMLTEAKRKLDKFKDTVDIRFIHGDAIEFPSIVGEPVDAIIYCNSIHYVKNKVNLMESVKNLLNRGGVFAANSSFVQESHNEAYVGSDHGFYMHLMLNAVKALKKTYKMIPKKSVVEARRRLNTNDYAALVEGTGMKVLHKEIEIHPLGFECWNNFFNFKDFIEGALPGIPIPVGRSVLKRALRKLMVEQSDTGQVRYEVVPRAWLQLVAQKV